MDSLIGHGSDDESDHLTPFKRQMSKMGDPRDSYSLKWNSFSSHLHTCVASALSKENFADVYLYTIDGRRILAHRFVLSASSQYLHDLLKIQQRMPTTLPLVIILPPDINYKTLSILIRYMYTGEATVSKNMLKSVLKGADLLKVKGLWQPPEDKHYEQKLVINERDIIRPTTNNQQGSNNSLTTVEPKILESTSEHKDNIVSQEKSNCSSVEEAHVTKKKPRGVTGNNNKSKPNIKGNIDKTRVELTEPLEVNKTQVLVVKKEPMECNKLNENETEMIEDDDKLHNETVPKLEVVINNQEEKPGELCKPLTCELCTETFKLPAEWVRHIQTHTEVLPAKRMKPDKTNDGDEDDAFPPLRCGMCQKCFPTPAEWVHHIQNTHAGIKPRVFDKTNFLARPIRVRRQGGYSHKTCTVCKRICNSRASMLIHRRTHTGEKPYMCEHCQKGFNVKSNLLRHLRTMHDKIIKSTNIDNKEINVAAWSDHT